MTVDKYPLISREEARARGLKRYFHGRPCKHGHISERYVSDQKCYECKLQYARDNPEKIKVRKKNYYESNKKECLEKRRIYYQENKEYISKWAKVYTKSNREKINACRRKKLEEDVNFKIGQNLRNRMNLALKNKQKKGSAVRDLGCTIEEFKQYIENQFTGEMSWKNWGSLWQLDHSIPVCSLNLEDREQFLKVANYTNIKPMLIDDHRRKTVGDVKKSLRRQSNINQQSPAVAPDFFCS